MLFFFIEYNGDLPVLDSFPTRRSSDLTRRSFVGSSLRERRAEHGETALRFGFRRLVLHDVPVLRETSSLDAKDVDDDPGRPPTPTEAAVDHDVVALGYRERALIPPGETAHQREQPVPSG